jgi:hypothetical protein
MMQVRYPSGITQAGRVSADLRERSVLLGQQLSLKGCEHQVGVLPRASPSRRHPLRFL